MNLIDLQNSLVIDVTYNCNAKCPYCRWGNQYTEGRINQPDEYVYIPLETLVDLGTERVVFSGGEPLLRHDLENIISYYKSGRLQSIIAITNGFLLNPERLLKLLSAGLTGITFSMDDLNGNDSRAYTEKQRDKVIANFIQTCEQKERLNIEIGVNVVVSTANIKNNEIFDFVSFLNQYPVDFVKFQPIFDDGYVGKNSPNMLLSSKDASIIRSIGKSILNIAKMDTNSDNFWGSLADILEGKKLVGNSCGLDTRQAMAQNGKIKICPWIDYPVYDLTKMKPEETRKEFSLVKANCNTGTFCYCLQNLSHEWITA